MGITLCKLVQQLVYYCLYQLFTLFFWFYPDHALLFLLIMLWFLGLPLADHGYVGPFEPFPYGLIFGKNIFLLLFLLVCLGFANFLVIDLEWEAIQPAIQVILDYDFIRSAIPHQLLVYPLDINRIGLWLGLQVYLYLLDLGWEIELLAFLALLGHWHHGILIPIVDLGVVELSLFILILWLLVIGLDGVLVDWTIRLLRDWLHLTA